MVIASLLLEMEQVRWAEVMLLLFLKMGIQV